MQVMTRMVAMATTQPTGPAYLGFHLSLAYGLFLLLLLPTASVSGISIGVGGGGLSRELRQQQTHSDGGPRRGGRLGSKEQEAIVGGDLGMDMDNVELDNNLLAMKTLQELHDYATNNGLLLQDSSSSSVPPVNKRLSPSGFYGARGRRGGHMSHHSSNAFYGSRGRRAASAGDGHHHLYFPSGKRIDPDTFFGMRGKRTGENDFQKQQKQRLKFNIERYLGELLAETAEEEEDPYMDQEVVNGGVMVADDNNMARVEEDEEESDMADKQMLLKLVDYFLSHRFQREDTTDSNGLQYGKTKRQPPSGFHAIRGR